MFLKIPSFNSKRISKSSIFLTPWQSKDEKSMKKNMPGPGFEPGLLRPQRSVLTTRRSRLTILPTAGCRQKILQLTLIGAPRILKLEL